VIKIQKKPLARGFGMLDRLVAQNFQVDFRSHAKAILSGDFPDVAAQLEDVLLTSTIPIEELIGSGGGEAKGTQRLRNALKQRGWQKHKFVVQRIIDGIEREAQSHEVDHVRTFEGGTVALEIEWNNKDPFFDRDLENFKRLHADGAISLGVIITRLGPARRHAHTGAPLRGRTADRLAR
jgi:hypothetical protein